MKLFFDENLSSTLVQHLSQRYPESSHVRGAQLVGQADSRIWDYCKEHDFIIVSKDTDFRERSFTEGFPPKVIWLDVGNAGTTPLQTCCAGSTGGSSGLPPNQTPPY